MLMTKKRWAVYELILENYRQHKPPPTYREMTATAGYAITGAAVYNTLVCLEKMGLIVRVAGKSRVVMPLALGRVIEKGRITGYTKGLEVYWI